MTTTLSVMSVAPFSARGKQARLAGANRFERPLRPATDGFAP
jgi:hypothetical protein